MANELEKCTQAPLDFLSGLQEPASHAQSLGPYYFSILLFFLIPLILIRMHDKAREDTKVLLKKWFIVSNTLGGLSIIVSLVWWAYSEHLGQNKIVDDLKTLRSSYAALENTCRAKHFAFLGEFEIVPIQNLTSISVEGPVNNISGAEIVLFSKWGGDSPKWQIIVSSDSPIESKDIVVQILLLTKNRTAIMMPVPVTIKHNNNTYLKIELGEQGAKQVAAE